MIPNYLISFGDWLGSSKGEGTFFIYLPLPLGQPVYASCIPATMFWCFAYTLPYQKNF